MSDGKSPFDAIFDGHEVEPMVAAQRNMRADLPKRFWKEVSVQANHGLFEIALDGRLARTPGRAPLASANEAIASEIAGEWRAIEERLDPMALPLTRLINVAIDHVEGARDAMVEEIASYAGSDLLCYRADRPQGLVDMQMERWDPPLDWLAETHGARLALAAGVMPATQSTEAIDAVRAATQAKGAHSEVLAALSLATTLTGSAVLALYLASGVADADAVWQAAHVDEDWNRQQWGEDEEASRLRSLKRRDFDAAAFVLEAHLNV